MKKIINKNSYHTSFSNYWSYRFQNNKNYMGRIIIFIKNIIENLFKIKILKEKNFGPILDRQTYLISKELNDRKHVLLSNILKKFLLKLKIKCSNKHLIKSIKEHDKIYYKLNPILNNSGGIGYNNSLFLYIFLKNIKIDLAIESGVWQGFTSYIIDSAKKRIRNIKFDISFSKLIYKSDKAIYNEFDINEYDFKNYKKHLKNSFAFFDDHYSQLDRFLLSHKLGMPFIVFDDDLTYEAIHSDGWPALPTISMIKENKLLNKFRWYNNGKIAEANLNIIVNKKKLNDYMITTAPNISNITGYYVQSPMTFLRKKKYKL